MCFITITNDGMRVTETNYFHSEWARRGIIQVTVNDSAFRLSIPPSLAKVIHEMRTAEEVVVTWGRATGVGKRGCPFEFMFEDGSEAPFIVAVGESQVYPDLSADIPPCDDLRCLVYTKGPTLSLDLPARYRMRKSLPCLEPWAGK